MFLEPMLGQKLLLENALVAVVHSRMPASTITTTLVTLASPTLFNSVDIMLSLHPPSLGYVAASPIDPTVPQARPMPTISRSHPPSPLYSRIKMSTIMSKIAIANHG